MDKNCQFCQVDTAGNHSPSCPMVVAERHIGTIDMYCMYYPNESELKTREIYVAYKALLESIQKVKEMEGESLCNECVERESQLQATVDRYEAALEEIKHFPTVDVGLSYVQAITLMKNTATKALKNNGGDDEY